MDFILQVLPLHQPCSSAATKVAKVQARVKGKISSLLGSSAPPSWKVQKQTLRSEDAAASTDSRTAPPKKVSFGKGSKQRAQSSYAAEEAPEEQEAQFAFTFVVTAVPEPQHPAAIAPAAPAIASIPAATTEPNSNAASS